MLTFHASEDDALAAIRGRADWHARECTPTCWHAEPDDAALLIPLLYTVPAAVAAELHDLTTLPARYPAPSTGDTS